MKVITKCIIDMKTLQVIEEESYDYFGIVHLCGSSGGGGGSSGKVDFPDHMKDWHYDALNNSGADTLVTSMTDVMNAAIGNDPFIGMSAYDPDAEVAAMLAAPASFGVFIEALNQRTEWSSSYDVVVTKMDWETWAEAYAIVRGLIDWDEISDSDIEDDVAAFSDQLDDIILTKDLPRFEAGMRDINAVVSSAFVIGRAIIEGMRDRDVAKHSSGLRLDVSKFNLDSSMKKEELRALTTNAYLADQISRKNSELQGTDQIMRTLISKFSWREAYARLVIESNRMKIVAKKEENEANYSITESSATWDLEVFQYGANLLSSIGGGTFVPREKKRNTAATALGGALSGAAGGAMIGGPMGAAIGGVLGLGAGLLY
jgi:hypothetical protein